MNATHVRRLPACISLLLFCAGAPSQEAVLPLPPPVRESPLLLPVPKLPSDDANAVPVPAPSVPFAPKTASSTSAGRQFIVHGGDLDLRSAFCLLCEDTAAALGRVLKDDAKFVLPVIVVLKTPPDITITGPAVTLSIGELTHGGFHLQINAQIRTGFRTSDFTRELVRVLLAERILRHHKKLSTTRQNDVLPAWVMTGVAQALDYRSRSRPSALFSAVFRRGQVYSLDRILSADPSQLDALSRGIYETSTCALVLTLLDQPDGPVRFSKFLNALAAESRSDRDLLAQHFPNLAASKNALEKWWSLQMASLATPGVMEALGTAQTEDELDDALMLILPGAKKEETPATEPEDKKGGGFFSWLKRDAKDEPAPAVPKPEEKKQEPPAGSQPAEPETKEEEAKPLFRAPSLPNPFSGGRKIIFPFKKKPGQEDGEADKEKEARKAAAKPQAGPSKPAASTPSNEPKSKPKDEPPASLTRKPGDARSIGGRPDDLPKAPPAVARPQSKTATSESNAKEPAPEPPEESPQAANRRLLNPMNWFRKSPDAPEAPAKEEKPAAEAARKETQAGIAQAAATRQPRAAKPGSIPIEDFALIARRPDRTEILNRCITRLSALKLRAHPLYKPLITGYTAVVQDLVQGKTKGAAARLEELRTQRASIHARAIAVESHLDWHEANHTGTLSHAFDDFLRLDEQIEKERLPRNDALSQYLDALQKEFQPQ